MGEAADLVGRATPALLRRSLDPEGYRLWQHTLAISRFAKRIAMTPNGRGIVTVPPQYGKSDGVSRSLPLWYLDWFPARRVILASYGSALARAHGRWLRNTIEENPDKLRLRLAPDSKAANQWNTPQAGGLLTAGVGSAMTGFGGDIIVLDDLIKGPAEAASQAVRDGTWDWLLGVTRTRLQPGGSMLAVGTRWHEDDPIGRLKEGVAGEWEELRLPALAEEDDPLGREPGVALCPGRYPQDEVEALATELGPYLFQAIMQQRPAPPKGDMFYRDTWEFVDVLPPRTELVRFWDLAATPKKSADRTAGALVAVGEDGVFIVDVIADRLPGSRVKRLVELTAEMDKERFGGRVHTMIEQEPGASGKTLGDEYVHEVLAGFSAESVPSSGDKIVRATPLASRQQGGRVAIVRTDEGATPRWVPDLIDEAAMFPHGAHDDVVDAVSAAYNHASERLRAKRKRRSKGVAQSVATRDRPTEPQTVRRSG